MQAVQRVAAALLPLDFGASAGDLHGLPHRCPSIALAAVSDAELQEMKARIPARA